MGGGSTSNVNAETGLLVPQITISTKRKKARQPHCTGVHDEGSVAACTAILRVHKLTRLDVTDIDAALGRGVDVGLPLLRKQTCNRGNILFGFFEYLIACYCSHRFQNICWF